MRQLLWDADGVAEVSFILGWWWQLFPLRHWSPVDFSPVDIVVNGRVLECRLPCPCECLDAGVLFFEELDDCFFFPLVGSGGVAVGMWWQHTGHATDSGGNQ